MLGTIELGVSIIYILFFKATVCQHGTEAECHLIGTTLWLIFHLSFEIQALVFIYFDKEAYT